MKPITDDIVLSLIEGAKRRQHAIAAANDAHGAKGELSPRGKIISLDLARPVRRVRQTVNGVFFYSPRH